jgi:proteasome lid subunit RPN8/RPN11
MRWRDEAVDPAGAGVSSYLARLEAAFAAQVQSALDDGLPVVVLAAEARALAERHVAPSRLERGGLLLGEPFRRAADDSAIALVHVRAAVPSDADDATAISLRMEADVWSRAREVLRTGEVVVGWFHSHPGIGAFFSETDRRTQAAFFRHPFSAGWVIDPLRQEEAWFLGADAAALAAQRVLDAPA